MQIVPNKQHDIASALPYSNNTVNAILVSLTDVTCPSEESKPEYLQNPYPIPTPTEP